MNRLFDIKDRNIIVTGAAGGMGSVICKTLAQCGANVALVDITDQAIAKSVINEVKFCGTKTLYYKCDVTDTEEVSKAFRSIIEDFGSVDVLLNNAAKCRLELAENLCGDWFDETIAVSLKGAFNFAKIIAGYAIKNERRAKIINMSSIAGLIGLPRGTSHHSAAKAGVIGLTKALAVEWAKYNITVNAIAPGQIGTPPLLKIMEDEKNASDILSNIPLGRIGREEEIAGAVVYLSSDASDFMTGHTLVIDGGTTIS